MGNETSKEIVEDYETKQIKEILEKDGPEKLKQYLMKNLQRWKNEEVRFAITGRSGTGKSTFINKVRGVSRYDGDNWAKSGSGNTTLVPTPYKCPTNSRIVYWDLPGIGTTQFKRENYAEEVTLESYDMFIIFIHQGLSEDDVWLADELTKMKKTFCFVRSRVDNDIDNAEYDGTNKDNVIENIRLKLLSVLSKSEKKLFIISSRNPSIGDWQDLLSYIEESLPGKKFEAFVFSLAGITSSVIAKKKQTLKSRIKYVALAAASVAAIPVPGVDLVLNMKIISDEVLHYKATFGMENLESSIAERLECSKYLNRDNLPSIIQASFPKYIGMMAVESVADVYFPIVGSLVSSVSTLGAVSMILKNVLDMFSRDAYKLDEIIRQNVK